MSAEKRPADQQAGGQPGPGSAGRRSRGERSTERAGEGAGDAVDVRAAMDGRERGPQSIQPWGTTGGTEDRDAPWGAAADSPLDEGSEETGLPPARRGERRADQQPSPWSPAEGRHGFGTVEPTATPEAGPGGAPQDPGPHRPMLPDDTTLDDLRNNPLGEQTGMHSEGVSRRE